MLGGHVGDRAADSGLLGMGSLVVGEIEVEEQRLPSDADQDVGRLDVAMQDAALVGVLEPVGELCDDPGDGLDEAGSRSRTTGVRPSAGEGESGPAPTPRATPGSVSSRAAALQVLSASTSSPPSRGFSVARQSCSSTRLRLAPPRKGMQAAHRPARWSS